MATKKTTTKEAPKKQVAKKVTKTPLKKGEIKPLIAKP